MNAQRWNAQTLRAALVRIGVNPVLVERDLRRPQRLHVFLHGHDGRSAQQEAITYLQALDGISGVEVSDQTWTILRVEVTGE